MLDEQRVDRDPVLAREDLREAALRFLGGSRVDGPESVGDAVDVGVDGDGGDPIAEDEHAVRGLRADAGETDEVGERTGDLAVVPVADLTRHGADRARLRVVEAGEADQRLELARRRGGDLVGARVLCEQSGARDVGRLVPRPLREDRADQHLERVLGVVAQVRRPPVARVIEGGEPIEDRLPVDRGRAGSRAHGRPEATGSGRRAPAEAVGADPVPGSERSGSSLPPCASRRSSPMR